MAQPNPVIGPVAAPALHVMTWNIRRRVSPNLRKADRWGLRAPRLQALLQAEHPTVLGVQEARPDQAVFVREALGMHYRFVGHGRGAGGRGEGCPIFYDSARLELHACEQVALSQTPTRAGSRSWGNVIPRIMVSAAFRDRATSKRFLAVNTHLDPLSARSRLRSARSIRAVLARSALPAVMVGDLNDTATSAPLRELRSDAMLTDTWTAAQTRVGEEWGTFANYRTPRPDRRRIDWILASPQFHVLRAAINAQRHEDGWASDHLPVQAVLTLSEDAPGT